MSVENPSKFLMQNIAYYFLLSVFSCVTCYVICSSLNELMNIFFSNQLKILEMERQLLESTAEVLQSVQSTMQNAVKEEATLPKTDWSTWLKPVIVSVCSLFVRHVINLCCHMLPPALFKLNLLGPFLKFILLGPESLLVEQLSPAELQEKLDLIKRAGYVLNINWEKSSTFQRNNALLKALEVVKDKIEVLEVSRTMSHFPRRPRPEDDLINEILGKLSQIQIDSQSDGQSESKSQSDSDSETAITIRRGN